MDDASLNLFCNILALSALMALYIEYNFNSREHSDTWPPGLMFVVIFVHMIALFTFVYVLRYILLKLFAFKQYLFG